MKSLFGNDVVRLAIEQLQSDEESTNEEDSAKLKVVRPSWRSEKVRKSIIVFKKLRINF